MASVKVAVRVRPFNQREIDMGAELIIKMKNKTTGIINNKANTRDEHIRYKEFTFDHSYWSHNENSTNYASQETVYEDLGTEVVDCAFQGYNACVFAYGQTGSGKTFTMMGSPDNQGLIPRICKALFDKMDENSRKGITHRVQVSYLEIYQEKVADLLRGRDSTSLKVREHPKKGPYVQGLTTCLVTNYGHIQECMNRGNSNRTTASTNMNDVSSRSHAIFTITFVQAGYCDGVPSETVSKIHLVDLAGSERADATGATGQRLKEGAHINKSLVTLGSVISALAELSTTNSDQNNHRKSFFIPYRDSVLTWLLKDSLGGNSKTIMIAAISPADCNYGETLSTLRYANRAKNIINKPTVNEDPNVKLIRELRDEIAKLKSLMFSEHRSDMLAQLHEKEAREKELTEEWAGKWREAQAILREQRALGLRKSGPGVVLDSDRPHLVAIDDDPLSTGVTLYHLKEGETRIGTEDSNIKQDIELRGAGMEPQHCIITFKNGVATLHPQPGAHVMLNNNLIETPSRLSQGCIIFLGKAHVFRFNDPAEAAELRKGEKTYNLSRLSLLSWSTPDLANSMENLQQFQPDFENQRLNFEKTKEEFEREQEEFEKKRRHLEEAQAKLEEEKRVIFNIQNGDQNLKVKGTNFIQQRNEIEREREFLISQINSDFECLEKRKNDFMVKLHDFFKFSNISTNDCTFKEFYEKSIDGNDLSGALKEFVYKHREELAELQTELDKRVETLSERKKTVEILDRKLLDLIDEQSKLDLVRTNNDLEQLKRELASRSREEIEKIETRKQSLTLDLKNLNPVTYSIGTTATLSSNSDTYHTAASDCSSITTTPFTENVNKKNMMSDSGVELRLSSKNQDESDLSSTDDCKIHASDSRSTSSMETKDQERPILRRKKLESLRKLSYRISQQKQSILKSLDGNCGKLQLDSQISVLQELQRQYVTMKSRTNSLTLTPADEHPLQDDSDSPSPLKPIHTGSTSTLYSNEQVESRRISRNFCRSMPSVTEPDDDSLVTISSYCLRGAGSKTHYEYEVRINTIDERWCILRRYSRFRDLHIAMKAKYGKMVSSIPFPSKQLFALNSESIARSRKRQLEIYLQKLIEICKNSPNCPLNEERDITKNSLIKFSPFFKKGVFENGKYGTS